MRARRGKAAGEVETMTRGAETIGRLLTPAMAPKVLFRLSIDSASHPWQALLVLCLQRKISKGFFLPCNFFFFSHSSTRSL